MGTNILTSSHSGKQRQHYLGKCPKTPDTQGRPLSPSSRGPQPHSQLVRNRHTCSQHDWKAGRKQGLASLDRLSAPHSWGTEALIPLAEPMSHPVTPGFSAKLLPPCHGEGSPKHSKHTAHSWVCLASHPAALALGAEHG